MSDPLDIPAQIDRALAETTWSAGMYEGIVTGLQYARESVRDLIRETNPHSIQHATLQSVLNVLDSKIAKRMDDLTPGARGRCNR